MRGLSFSASRRSRASDRSITSNPQTPSPTSSTSSVGLLKRLSTHFRRDSPKQFVTAPIIPGVERKPLRPDHDSTRAQQHAVVDDIARLQAIASARLPGKARAMTFSAPDSAKEIPFFGAEGRGKMRGARRQIAQVQGKPAWLKKKGKNEEVKDENDRVKGEGEMKVGVIKKEGKRGEVLVESNYKREHAFSFSVAEKGVAVMPSVGKGGAMRAKSMNVDVEPNKPMKPRYPHGRRWMMPLTERAECPRLFTPPAGGMFERITARRDRTEARALVSACTFLEAEIGRIESMAEKDEKDCKKKLETSVERLRGVLNILEDRYDTIEQVYVKSEEYAVAMGRFFEVSPRIINKLAAGHRDLAGECEKRKSTR